jgi:hypothetical protein
VVAHVKPTMSLRLRYLRSEAKCSGGKKSRSFKKPHML